MAEQPTNLQTALEVLAKLDPFPSAQLPVIYADGILSITRAAGIVKLYFFRVDSNLKGERSFNAVPVAQVVMPAAGFLSSSIFMDLQVKQMLEKNEIEQAKIDEIRATFEVQAAQQAAKVAQAEQSNAS